MAIIVSIKDQRLTMIMQDHQSQISFDYPRSAAMHLLKSFQQQELSFHLSANILKLHHFFWQIQWIELNFQFPNFTFDMRIKIDNLFMVESHVVSGHWHTESGIILHLNNTIPRSKRWRSVLAWYRRITVCMSRECIGHETELYHAIIPTCKS